MYLVRGCALVGSLPIRTYSFTRLPFVITIISVNGSESVGPVVHKCRSTWQDLFNRYACACCVISNGPQDPLGTERWVIMSTKGTTSACSADITSEQTRRAATNHGLIQEKGQGAAGYGSVKGANTCTYARSNCPRQGWQRKRGVLALGVGVNRSFCAVVSREFYWTSTAAVHIIPVSLSGRWGGAAAIAKPRGTISVRLCFMDVSNCARLKPFRLSGLVEACVQSNSGIPSTTCCPRRPEHVY